VCGRYDLSDNPAAIKAHFKLSRLPEFAPNPDWRPTDRAPIVRRARGSDEREAVLAHWGLVPHWAKDLKFGVRCINARAETVATAAAFREAYRHRRCLVPVNAFYEWSGEKGHKIRWRIALKDEPLFALAGLWEWWRDRAASDSVETYTIVTTEANPRLAEIHDRMPVIVAPDDYERWLDPADAAQDLLTPFENGALRVAQA
jgi:putative SOS response-associated peptidase YedK